MGGAEEQVSIACRHKGARAMRILCLEKKIEEKVEVDEEDEEPKGWDMYEIPPEDPTVKNSLSAWTCTAIFLVCFLYTDQMWGLSNHHCIVDHSRYALDSWAEQLAASIHVQNDCMRF